ARHAAFLLGLMGPEAVPRLLHALARQQSRIDPIAEAMAAAGRPALESLTQAIQAPEPRLRQGAALALGQIRPLTPGTARKLAAGLRDPDRRVRAARLAALGDLRSSAAGSVPDGRGPLPDRTPRRAPPARRLLL